MTDQNELIEKKSWWKRNWVWVVPTGGCGCVVVFVIMLVGGIFAGVNTIFTSSAPYQEALTEVQNNQQIIELLGEPIKKSGMMQGSISYSNDDGEADFSIPIEGPKGEGRLYIIGKKQNGIWTYSELEVRIYQNNEVINLLNEGLDKEEDDF